MVSSGYFFTVLLDYLSIIPVAVLCFFPMKNQMRLSVERTLKIMIPIGMVTLFELTWLTCQMQTAPNTMLFPFMILFFFMYHKLLKVHISKTLAIFAEVCVFESLISDFSLLYDSLRNPTSGADVFSVDAASMQFLLTMVLVVLIAHPVKKYGSYLVDHLNLPIVWFTTLSVSFLFFFVAVMIRPIHYETLHTNNVFLAYIVVTSVMFLMMSILTVIFYFTVSGMLRENEIEERNRMLEMQESQYIKQKNYMEMSSAARHDFRQTIRTLENLAREDNLEEIKEYLKEYVDTLPVNDVLSYTPNHAVNALLNYYHEVAEPLGIHQDWQVELPKDSGVSNIDLCNIIGNLLENAIWACRDVEEEKRYIDLSVMMTESNSYLCIVMTNPYGTPVKKENGRYLSTRKNGSGIGLTSIQSTTERYHGVANFTDKEGEFYSDIMLSIG